MTYFTFKVRKIWLRFVPYRIDSLRNGTTLGLWWGPIEIEVHWK